MVRHYSETWWLTALRGLAAVIFGIAAIALPDVTLAALVWLFAGYAIVDGVLSLIASITGRETNTRWWIGLLEGVVGIVVGVLAFIWPDITALALLLFIAAWALVTGVMEIVAAVRLREQITNEWLLAISGALSIVFGVLLLINPAAGALAVVTLIGIYAIIFGVVLIAFGFRMRGDATTNESVRGSA